MFCFAAEEDACNHDANFMRNLIMSLLFPVRPALLALLGLSPLWLAGLAAPTSAEEAAPSLVLMPFTFVDTSGEPRNQTVDHEARLTRMSAEIGKDLEAGGLYRVVAMPPALKACEATDS